MTTAAVGIALLVAAWMTWRGYRRGATGTLAAWLPFIALGAVLTIGFWAAFLAIDHLAFICVASLLAGVAALALCHRLVRRGLSPAHGSSQRGGPCALLSALNRFSGAFLGLFAAAFILVALSLLGSAVSLACTLGSRHADGAAVPPPRWVESLGRACCTVADFATFGVLDSVPKLGDYAREVAALVKLLSAPRAKLEWLARKRGFVRLAELPEVQAALLDDAYTRLVARAGRGNAFAIQRLARHPTTRRLLACAQVRRLAANLSPSELVRELAAAPSPHQPPSAATPCEQGPSTTRIR